MNIDLNHDEFVLLTELVELRINELQPEVRSTRSSGIHDRLKTDLWLLEGLVARLRQADKEMTRKPNLYSDEFNYDDIYPEGYWA